MMEERKGRRLGAGQGGSCRGGGGDMWRLLGDILQDSGVRWTAGTVTC